MTFYEKYVALCRERGYKPSGKTMQDFLGLSSSTITSWKSGVTPRMETLRVISKFFNVSIDYLLGETEERESKPCLSAKQSNSAPEDSPSSPDNSNLQMQDASRLPSDVSSSTAKPMGNGHSLIDVSADERFLIELFRSLDPIGRARILHVAMSEDERQRENET